MINKSRLFSWVTIAALVSLSGTAARAQQEPVRCPLPTYKNETRGDGGKNPDKQKFAPVEALQNPGLEVVAGSKVNEALAKSLQASRIFRAWSEENASGIERFDYLIVRYLYNGPSVKFTLQDGTTIFQTPVRYHIRVVKNHGARGTFWVDGLASVAQHRDGQLRRLLAVEACEYGPAELGDVFSKIGSNYDPKFVQGVTAGVLGPALAMPGAFNDIFALTVPLRP